MWRPTPLYRLVFFFNDTATTEIYTLSLHDALPICVTDGGDPDPRRLPEHPLGSPEAAEPEHRLFQALGIWPDECVAVDEMPLRYGHHLGPARETFAGPGNDQFVTHKRPHLFASFSRSPTAQPQPPRSPVRRRPEPATIYEFLTPSMISRSGRSCRDDPPLPTDYAVSADRYGIAGGDSAERHRRRCERLYGPTVEPCR